MKARKCKPINVKAYLSWSQVGHRKRGTQAQLRSKNLQRSSEYNQNKVVPNPQLDHGSLRFFW